MAANLNKVFVIGNLTRDPELRYVPSGQAVTSFTVAVNRVYKDQAGEKKEEATFLRVVTWGKRAEVCNEYLKKGSSVFVEGRLQSRNWQAQDGSKRTTMEIVAQSVQFLARSGSGRKEAPHTPAKSSKEEMIVDDSFAAGDEGQSINITPNELSPDDEVPF
ncbi:MAG: single-stranded DNA-binding protein [Candidatus Omnitrophica bacterium]|nr:single-stranded DNA-binding protein [Candidatus Omnitrophota bacterium]